MAYQLSNESPDWLWVVNALLVVHWVGDSLDGTLARVRGIQRPKYGYAAGLKRQRETEESNLEPSLWRR